MFLEASSLEPINGPDALFDRDTFLHTCCHVDAETNTNIAITTNVSNFDTEQNILIKEDNDFEDVQEDNDTEDVQTEEVVI
ncbi:hypothetical protein L1987_30430 [Smallanthus sonchifolius]|uniref:Uncharacterized protein n=1 Tax=Smallanthus sonchifolius TaxID=185202 RepID=A0ACB9I478_9ASTR|nr:hypothetical protein L1987_30430 [Smallanthus sonchifolius]